MASKCLDILHVLDITNVLPKCPLLSPLCVGCWLAMPLGGSRSLPDLRGFLTSQIYCPSSRRISRLALLQGKLDGQKREVGGTHSTICAFPYQLKGRRGRPTCVRRDQGGSSHMLQVSHTDTQYGCCKQCILCNIIWPVNMLFPLYGFNLTIMKVWQFCLLAVWCMMPTKSLPPDVFFLYF